jgi:hypothetical protein
MSPIRDMSRDIRSAKAGPATSWDLWNVPKIIFLAHSPVENREKTHYN